MRRAMPNAENPRSRIRPATLSNIADAAGLIRQGRLVAMPTETVYGLAADAGNEPTVAAIFAAKDRPSFNPLIVHVPDAATADRLGCLDTRAVRLAKQFWPGALTLVVRRRAHARLSQLVSAGLDTVAVRVPAHPIAQVLLSLCGRPLAAPSANRSGRISPTAAAHVEESLGSAVDLILDGGPCPIGLESTVVDLTGPVPRLLRAGGVPLEHIEAELGRLESAEDATRPASPGQLPSHYAPELPLRLDATSVAPDEALLAFGPGSPAGALATLNLSSAGDLTEAASHFFDYLRKLDQSGARRIAAMPIPEHGLGRAINDRLRRAAAPR
jgi:L-threonylcarbamoyladenylate synthase